MTNNPIRLNGRETLMHMLRAEGVRYIFGNPGTSESPILHTLESFPELRYILVAQEGVAMGMADAYARSSGIPAFVNLHIETGLANGISLLQNARDGGTPMVITAGNKDSRELAHGRTNLSEMVQQFTKWSAEINHPAQIPYAVRRAFKEAKTPPTGPTFLSFSADSLDGQAEVEIIASGQNRFEIGPDPLAIVSLTTGALIIFPSKTIANCLPIPVDVALPNLLAPTLSKVNETIV